MEIKQFNDNDFNSVLEFLNRNMKFDFMTQEILKEKLYQDPFFDYKNTFTAKIKNQIIGFLQGVTRNIENVKYGFVKLFAVDKNFRRQDIGRKLYEKTEDNFKKQNVEIVRVYDVPLNYFMPGIDPRYTPALCFFENSGFKRFGETCNLKVELKSKNWCVKKDIEKLKHYDIFINRAENSDEKELLEFLECEWKLWKHEVKTALKYKPKAVHVARYKRKIKAFSAYNGNNIGTAWFGPMGTHKDLRGKGIGGILLKLCLQDMKNQGFEYSTIPWVGPISFYSNYAGASVERVFWRYQKKI